MRCLCVLLAAVGMCPAQTVTGTVTDSVTGRGIAGAEVLLYPDAGKKDGIQDRKAETDAGGRYRFEALENSGYSVVVSADHYVGAAMGKPLVRRFRMAGAALIFDFTLTPAAKIAGRVLDPDGRPVAAAEVNLVGSGSGTAFQKTGDDGSFEFADVHAGKYTLTAAPPAGWKAPTREGARGAHEGNEELGWPSVSFPGTLEVQAGWQLSGQDLRLKAAPVHRIRGTVFDDRGEPAGGARVTFFRAKMIEKQEGAAVTGKDGTFESPGLFDGTFRMRAEAAKLRGSRMVDVAGKDVDRQDLPMRAPFHVKVSVELPDGVTKPGGCPQLSSMAPLASPTPTNPMRPATCVGYPEFSIADVYEGTYGLLPGTPPPGDSYLDAIMMGGREATGMTVDLSSGGAGFRVIYKSGGGSIVGQVPDCHGCEVIAVPAEAKNWRLFNDQLLPRTTCGETGQFRLTRLRPGTYTLFAFDPARRNAIEMIRVPGGVSVTVQARETAGVQLKLPD